MVLSYAHMLNVANTNAWQIYIQNGGQLNPLAFRRIVHAVLEENKRVSSARGRPLSNYKTDTRSVLFLSCVKFIY